MRIKRPVIKRACDDYEDEWIWFEVGQYQDYGQDDVRKPLSVSHAAHKAIHYRPAPKIGFHRP